MILLKYQGSLKTKNNEIASSVKSENFTQNLEQNLNFIHKNANPMRILEQNLSENTTQIEQNLSEISKAQEIKNFEKNSSLEILNLKPENKDLNETLENKTYKEIPKNQIKISSKFPKLAIIIDDMSNKAQVKSLKELDLKLTPSFFPAHKDTPKLALEFEFFMVHLPLAALHYDKAEPDTLNINDSEEKILSKIRQIKKDFKGLKFINNHTGSLFTSNEEAMRKLFKAFKKEGFIFVDSKTTKNSKALKLAKEFEQEYIKRDVFLDNEDNIEYIKNQLQNAVNLAHKKGFAIAIAHPRKNTFKALKQSKELLKSVKLVYLSEIYVE